MTDQEKQGQKVVETDGEKRRTSATDRYSKKKPLTAEMASKATTALLLTNLGWSASQVAQILNVRRETVWRWKALAVESFPELPATRLAIDRLQAMVPMALEAYEAALRAKDQRVRTNAARDILLTFDVVKDKHTIKDERDVKNLSDSDLLAEAERIVQAKTEAVDDDDFAIVRRDREEKADK